MKSHSASDLGNSHKTFSDTSSFIHSYSKQAAMMGTAVNAGLIWTLKCL